MLSLHTLCTSATWPKFIPVSVALGTGSCSSQGRFHYLHKKSKLNAELRQTKYNQNFQVSKKRKHRGHVVDKL